MFLVFLFLFLALYFILDFKIAKSLITKPSFFRPVLDLFNLGKKAVVVYLLGRGKTHLPEIKSILLTLSRKMGCLLGKNGYPAGMAVSLVPSISAICVFLDI